MSREEIQPTYRTTSPTTPPATAMVPLKLLRDEAKTRLGRRAALINEMADQSERDAAEIEAIIAKAAP